MMKIEKTKYKQEDEEVAKIIGEENANKQIGQVEDSMSEDEEEEIHSKYPSGGFGSKYLDQQEKK